MAENKNTSGQAKGENEELFHALMETMMDSVIIIDWMGNLLFANNSAIKLVGLDKAPDDISSLNIRKFLHPDSVIQAFKDLALVRLGRGGFVTQYKIVTAKGETRWVECLKDLVRFKGKTADLITMRDVTERKAMEEAIRESEERYRNIFENSPVTVVYFDKESRILSINRRIRDLVGYEEKEVLGLKLGEIPFASEKVKKLIIEKFSGRIKGELIPDYETELIHKNSKKVAVLISGSVLRKDGQIAGTLAILTDITENKKLQKIIEEDEKKYRSIFDNSPEPIVVIDKRGVIIDINNKVEDAIGYKKEEFIGKKFIDLPVMTPQSRQKIQESFDKRIKGELTPTYELEFINSRGEKVYFIISATPIYSGDETVGVLAILSEVTKIKNLAEQLTKSEERYRGIFNNAIEGIYQSTPAGRLIAVNNAYAKIYGYSTPEEMIEKIKDIPHELYVKPEDWESFTRDVLEKGIVRDSAIRMKRKDGSPFWANVYAQSVRAPDGKITFEGSVLDISEQKIAESLLRETEQRYKTIVDNVRDIVYSIDLEGSLRFISPQIENLGYKTEELLGKSIFDFIHPEDTLRVLEEFKKTITTGTTFPTVFRLRKKDGKYVYIEEMGKLLREGGKIIQLTGVIRDISDRSQSERRIVYLNRVYAMLSQINQAIVHTSDIQQMFDSICTVAVEQGKFRMAWIAVVDEQTGETRRAAGCGYEDGYSEKIKISTDASEPVGRGPAGNALRSGKLAVSNNIESDPSMAPWKEEALKRGYKAAAAVPFRRAGKVEGVLNLYSDEPEFFTEEEKELLREIGSDISFALDSIEKEKLRKEAEQKLRESEERYRLLFNQAADSIVTLDKRGKFLQVNEKFVKETGYSESDVLGKNLLTLGILTAESSAAAGYYLGQYVLTGTVPPVFEVEGIKADKSRVYYEVNAKPVLTNGEMTAIQAILRNVTERKKTEEKVLVAAKEWSQTFNAMNDGILIIDMDHTVINANESMGLLLGKKRGDIVGQKCHRVIHSLDVPFEGCVFKKVVESRGREYIEIFEPRLHKWLAVSASPVFDDAGNLIRVIHVMRNITDKKINEEMVRLSEEKYRGIFDNAMEAMFQTTEDGKFISVNPAFSKMLGYSGPEEVIDRAINIEKEVYVNPEDRKIIIQEALSSAGLRNHIIEFKRKDGKHIWVSMSVKAVRKIDGSVAYFDGMAQDITDRKAAEEKNIHLASFPQYNPNPVIETDANGKIIYSNEATSKILVQKGVPNQTNLFLPEDFGQMLKALRSGEKKEYTREVKIKDSFFFETIAVLPGLQVIHIYAHDNAEHKGACDSI